MTQLNELLLTLGSTFILGSLFIFTVYKFAKNNDITITVTKREVKTIEPSSEHIDKHQQE